MSTRPPIPLAAYRYAFENADRWAMQREAKFYAKVGIGLAKAWRLAANIEGRIAAGYEKTRLNNAQQAAERERRKAMKQMRSCRECGLLFAGYAELRRHRADRHHECNAAPYKGRLLNPINWNASEISPSGGNGRRAVLKARHVAGSSPATGTTTLATDWHGQFEALTQGGVEPARAQNTKGGE